MWLYTGLTELFYKQPELGGSSTVVWGSQIWRTYPQMIALSHPQLGAVYRTIRLD